MLAVAAAKCSTSKVHALDFGAIHALERHEFLLMDTLVDFVFELLALHLIVSTLRGGRRE